MEITGHLQTYEWGKYGTESLVAQIFSSTVDFAVDAKTPYAELWMGIHKSGEAKVKGSQERLSEWLQTNAADPDIDGLNIQDLLPYLFKVLSVNKALSIQCHPNKSQAEDLFERMSDIFKDDNHKPEMTIALTEFEVMCGLRPVIEIQTYMQEVPELEMLISKESIRDYLNDPNDECMKKILKNWLTKKEGEMEPIITHFLRRLENEAENVKSRYLFHIVKQLCEWYPNDVGVFMPFFLNYFILQPGDCMFIAPGVPHAYIKGDCIECMSCSDNVVRCGLTPKLKEIDVLLEILDFNSYTVEELKMKGVPEVSDNVMVYNPPLQEFGLTRVTIMNEDNFLNSAYETCAIFIVLSGVGEITGKDEVKPLKFGSIFCLLPNEQCRIKCKKEGPMVLYFAYGVK